LPYSIISAYDDICMILLYASTGNKYFFYPIKRGRGSHMTLTLSKVNFSKIYIMKKN